MNEIQFAPCKKRCHDCDIRGECAMLGAATRYGSREDQETPQGIINSPVELHSMATPSNLVAL